MAAALMAAGLLAACTAPTPLPGAFETALAATVQAGSTEIAQGFAGQRATLTAAAPTATLTLEPSATPSETPIPTETATPTDTATPAATATPSATATSAATATRPVPVATATSVSSAGVPGTYTSGECVSLPAYEHITHPYELPRTKYAGLHVVCVPTIVVRPSLEMQLNVTWTLTRDGLPADQLSRVSTDSAHVPPYNGSVLYLADNLGRQASQVSLEGVARDGGRHNLGIVNYGYYLFAPAQPGATSFTLVDTHRKLTISNITLGAVVP